MKPATVSLFFAFLLSLATSSAKEIHGPITSWHLDPTSTMTIQWIEKLDASLAPGQWWLGKAGFGYEDDDDTTRVQMQNRFQRLYIRRKFGFNYPKRNESSLFFPGEWELSATMGSDQYSGSIVVNEGDEGLGGRITISDDEAVLRAIAVKGKNVSFELDYSAQGIDGRLQLSGRELWPDTIAGSWELIPIGGGGAAASGEWRANRTKKVEPRKTDAEKEKAKVPVHLPGEWAYTGKHEDKVYEGGLVFKQEGDNLTGVAKPKDNKEGTLADLSVDVKNVRFSFPFSQDGINGDIRIDATEKEEGKLSGTWTIVAGGQSLASGDWSAERKKKEEIKAPQEADPGKFDLILKIRYDDAFIA
ncbi:MAG: hypothetical protein AAF514_22090, partial [Verrucomicrobiota bacterium]